MVTIETKGKMNSRHGLGRPFQTERLDKSAYVEIHKSHGKTMGLVFHVGDFSLPLLRARPYQRIYDRVERHLLRPWVMGRVTYKKNILLENPGTPGILLNAVRDSLPGARHDGNDDLLSTAVWINGDRLDCRELFPKEDQGYFYKEIVVTTTPVLEQAFRTDRLSVMMEIILSSEGPVQRTTVEVVEGSPVDLDYSFIGMFPRNTTEYYAHDHHGNPSGGHLEHPSEGNGTAELAIPQARWLAAYNPDCSFGTLMYSPEFEKAEMSHLLVADRRQGHKVYHIVGDWASFAEVRLHSDPARMTIRPGCPQQLVLVARPIEADPGEWKLRAEEEASQVEKTMRKGETHALRRI